MGLSPLARWLLDAVVEQGLVWTDRSAQSIKGRAKILGQAARELEKRLLVYGESFHSDSGTHYKQLESWSHLSKRLRVSPRGMSREAARNEFERIAAGLNEQYGVCVRLPWKRGG